MTSTKGFGNSCALLGLPSSDIKVPAVIDSIFKIQASVDTVEIVLAAIGASIWSSELRELEIVKPGSVDSHYASLSFETAGLGAIIAVISLSRVSPPVQADDDSDMLDITIALNHLDFVTKEGDYGAMLSNLNSREALGCRLAAPLPCASGLFAKSTINIRDFIAHVGLPRTHLAGVPAMAKAVANSPMGSFWQSLAYPITLSRLRPAQPVLAAGGKQGRNFLISFISGYQPDYVALENIRLSSDHRWLSKKHGIMYLITKFGFVHSVGCIPDGTIFITAEHEATNGVIDDSQYQQFFQFGQLSEVAGFAANSPRGILRTTAVIESFKQAPACPGGPSSILQFGILLENGEFNILESLEVARPILQQGRHRI
ncbi:hypothetical protein BDZ97DRAFT_1760937 [Flammula alnicola]|nr:hypothetical protein BDZ97DRAFT_1760937 [Flammula alnicola]